MTKHRDPDALIASYLADGMEVLPDRVADAVLDEVHRTRQRAVFGPWRTRSTFKAVLGAAAVLAVLLLAGTLYLGQRGQPAVVAGPSQTPIARPSEVAPSEMPSPVATPRPAAVIAYINLVGRGTMMQGPTPGCGSWARTEVLPTSCSRMAWAYRVVWPGRRMGLT